MKKTINFMGVRNIAFAITALLTVLALFSWFYKGLNFGLDFTGGTLIELRYEQPADLGKIRQQLQGAGFEEAVVQSFGATTDVLVRMPGDDPQLGQKVTTALQQASTERFSLTRTEFVGPQVGEELRDQGGLGMLLALGGVLLYVAFRFQWKFAVGAIISLVHDVVVTLGLLSFFQITFDLTVLAAVLAIIGYSLNDTIVVFDRVRENFRVLRKASLIENINVSTTQTLLRTLATSISTLLAVAALLFFGGDNLFGFSLALFIGVLAGTYSSIYIANVVLIWLDLKSEDLIPPQAKELDDRP
ncbi:protein translocase subunit SecF [Pseudomonas oryzihabitans]|jgi:preprotein translocase subunit SecF|uniref:protein translocase subunit SecF n=1 Tax=Pseudomonas oryzihabitans TaxID=47885 RepID=UPI0007361142|nr:protein translocase subunit SecF [Pseudomonas psychrotolerans]KTT48228.1 preprotein translocase subunit SecF [Pseudomonas psychrotolerans]